MKFLQLMEFTGAPEDAEQALKNYIEKPTGDHTHEKQQYA